MIGVGIGLARFRQPFNPGSMFSNNEPGFFDTSLNPAAGNLWLDTARTTLATAPGDVLASWRLRTSGADIFATQATVGLRPILGREPKSLGRNLFDASELPTWSQNGVTATVVSQPGPDGVSRQVVRIVEGADATPQRQLSQIVSVNAGAYRIFTDFRADQRFRCNFTTTAPDVSEVTAFNLTTQEVTGAGSIVDLGNGWFRCIQNVTFPIAGSATVRIRMLNDAGAASYTGDGTSGMFVMRAQITEGATVFPYQRRVSAFDITEAGQRDCWYLFCGGPDNPRWLQTPAIDFTGTDKMTVFAGVRKLSDAALGIVMELGRFDLNAGTFFLAAPSIGGRRYGGVARGTAVDNLNLYTGITSTGAAPDSAVLVATHDIAGDLSRIRRNGVFGTDGTGDKGAGNFGNLAVFIGARSGGSLPLHARIYEGLCVRGAATDLATIQRADRAIAAGVPGVTL